MHRHGITVLGKGQSHGLPDPAGSTGNQYRFHQLMGAAVAASLYWLVSLVSPSWAST